MTTEAEFRDMPDEEFIAHILKTQSYNYFAVQAALRLDGLIAAIDDSEESDGTDA